jgi:chromosomal replication initiator protein
MANQESHHVLEEALCKYRKDRFAVECERMPEISERGVLPLDNAPVQNAFGQVAHTDVENAKCLPIGKTRRKTPLGKPTPTCERISPVSERPAHVAAAFRDARLRITFFPSPRAEKNLRRKLATPLLVLAEQKLTTPLLKSCRNTSTYIRGARSGIHQQNARRLAHDVAVFQHEKKITRCAAGISVRGFRRFSPSSANQICGIGEICGPPCLASELSRRSRGQNVRKSPPKRLPQQALISSYTTPRQAPLTVYWWFPFWDNFAALLSNCLDGTNVVQSVFSIPLGSGAATAPSVRARDTTPRPCVLGEFIAGPENRLAAIAVKSVFEDATSRVTPLVMYGPSGCGKTHLARGLAEWWERHHPTHQVLTLTGAEFAQQYAEAVENDRIASWRSQLRTLQMLVIDDLGGLAGKRGAQQELRHIVDELADCESLIVVTSQSLPTALQGLSDALRSRLSSGLAVPVNLPSAAARQMILERFATARGLSLSKRATETLADGLNVPAPMLLGALMELELAARADGKPLDAERIRRYVGSQHREKLLTVREIATVAAKYFNLKLADLKSPSRRQAIVLARSMAVYLARQLTDQSLTHIGEYFGGRDHTTALHGFRKIDKLAKSDPATRQALAELKRLIAMT